MVVFQITLAIVCALKLVVSKKHDVLSEDIINVINSKQNSWKAGRNFPLHTRFTYIEKLMGTLEDDSLPKKLPKVIHKAEIIEKLPEHFDPREKWPNCPSLNEIRDQGACGSCWALSAVSAMTDRYCIHSDQTKHFHFSADDLISCCETCGLGCIGGLHASAWEYWKNIGLVSGGNYNSHQGCRPYSIPPQESNGTDSLPLRLIVDASECIQTCESSYNNDYIGDKRHAKSVYYLDTEDDIKAELFENGPVEGVIAVYKDFLHYKQGVYNYTAGKLLGHHAVKIIGWGDVGGIKYWLAANCWNHEWGDKGFFKILRGEDHCRVESFVVAGVPQIL